VTLLNQKIARNKPLETLVNYELREDVVKEDDYLETRCIYWVTEKDEDKVFHGEGEDVPDDWTELEDDEEILQLFGDTGGEFVLPEGYSEHPEHAYWPCAVFAAEEKEDDRDGLLTYTVRLLDPSTDQQDVPPWAQNDIPRFLFDYPLESIRYFARPYRSDQHLRNAFRYPIGLNDKLVPPQWKNT
jgi:hypothetical protein